MSLKGRGIKSGFVKWAVRLIKNYTPVGLFYNSPTRFMKAADWIATDQNRMKNSLLTIHESFEREEKAPVISNHGITSRFSRYYRRDVPAAFIMSLDNAKVLGRSANFIVAANGILLSDLSREFGAYGGRPAADFSIITDQLFVPHLRSLDGRVAVITTTGFNNFHHWNYDCLPRLAMLKESGFWDTMDHFIIAHSDQPFQLESLAALGVPVNKIINPEKEKIFSYRATTLIVPSLPSELGTVSPWVVECLNKIYNPEQQVTNRGSRIFLSRKKVGVRNIRNQREFSTCLQELGFDELFPEDYSVSAFARIVAGASCIISVHGSGLSNLCFASAGTTVIDILAPFHQDGYYWMISNIRGCRYIGFFGEGEHPPDELDLVKNKRDDDITINMNQFRHLMEEEIRHHETV